MRILQVSTRDIGGGAETSAWNLFKTYRQRGLDSWLAVGSKLSCDDNVFVVRNEENRPSWTRFFRRLKAPGMNPALSRLAGRLAWIGEPGRLAGRFLGIEDFYYPGTARLLDLPPRRPTVVHCHNLHGNYFDLRVLPRLSAQVPLIINLRDAWMLSGHCAHSFECGHWKTGCGHCAYMSTYPGIARDATAYNWRRKRDIYARSRLYVTAISQWLMDKVRASMLKGVKYRVIPNAVDLNVFCPGDRSAARKELKLPAEAMIVLMTAHNMFKDIFTMETALAMLAKPDKTRRMIFICLGREGTNRPLGEGHIRYAGTEREPARMALFYRAADIYLHAAKAEAFGKAVTEAMACGIPVVASAVGGIPEQVEDGRTGFLARRSDAAHTAWLLQRLLNDGVLRERVSRAALARARTCYGLSRQADAFLDWYAEVTQDWEQWKANEKNYFK